MRGLLATQIMADIVCDLEPHSSRTIPNAQDVGPGLLRFFGP